MPPSATSAPGFLESDDEQAPATGGIGSLGSVLLLLVMGWVSFIALRPLRDNSFMTHLATGRLILEERSVPSTDVYSFTARGEGWTVQSWLASVIYAAVERLGGAVGLRLLVLLMFSVAVLLLWRLTAPAVSVFTRVGIFLPILVVATEYWSVRPYMVGVIGLALVWLALDGQIQPGLLIPIMWLWANIHGSFLLATVLAAAVLGGSLLDVRYRRRSWQVSGEVRVLGLTVAGSLLAVISPVGFELLTFPIRGLMEPQRFSSIVEWQAPEFATVADRAFLVFVVMTIVALVRIRRWRLVLPAMVFLVAALMARRNIVMAIVVLTPCISAGAPSLGSLRVTTRPRLGMAAVVLCLCLLGLGVATGTRAASVSLEGYPQNALGYLESNRYGPARLVSQDFVGNLLHAFDGAEADVFFDDRRDMYSQNVAADYDVLNRAEPNWDIVLSRWRSEVLVWERSHPLASLAAADSGWRVLYSDSRWMVACQRDRGCRDSTFSG